MASVNVPYQPPELEAVARLLLQERPVRLVPGAWWSYYPERGEVVYPPNLLAEWPGTRSLGALCHEIAEVLYSGREAVGVFQAFASAAEARRCEARSALLLLNAINDLRVNRLYLKHFPGCRRYLLSIYQDESLVLKDDMPGARGGAVRLPHHQFVDRLTARWTADMSARPTPPGVDGRVQRALALAWPAIARAISSDDLPRLAEIVQTDVLPVYADLLEASREELRRAESAVDDSDESPRNDDEEPEESGAGLLLEDLQVLTRGSPLDSGPAESWVLLTDESQAAEAEPDLNGKPTP